MHNYFASASSSISTQSSGGPPSGARDSSNKVRRTSQPPIYFQYRGHSLTIVGIERRTSGALELLVFDPMFRDPEAVMRLRRQRGISTFDDGSGGGGGGNTANKEPPVCRNPDAALKMYRRGNRHLKKYLEFEILRSVLPIFKRPVMQIVLQTSFDLSPAQLRISAATSLT